MRHDLLLSKLEPADARHVRAICAALDTLELDAKVSPWPAVVRATKSLLESEHLWCYEPRRCATGWEVPIWHTDGSLPEAHARFRRAVANERREWAWFKPTQPEARQRNRVVEAVAAATRARPGYFEESLLYSELFFPLRLHRHNQLRVLVCDGDRMLGWFGALQRDPVTRRQRAIMSAMIPSLQRRLATERRLEDALGVAGVLAAALELVGAAAFIVGAGGAVLHANTAGKALIDQRHGEIARALCEASAGRPHTPTFEITRAPDGTRSLAILRATEPPIADRVCIAAVRWRLTPRRRQVLTLLVEGHSTATIAELLGVTSRAVELHLTALFDCAGVDGRAALVARVLTL
jgi:DNA-binding CsgD family transcriptional regulator